MRAFISAISTVRRHCGNKIGRAVLIVLCGVPLFNPAAASESTLVHVAKTSSCGCCVAWIDHLEKNGLSVKSENMAMGKLMQFKSQNGISAKLASCHTGKVGNYTIEGHVPADQIQRLLSERPDAIGLAVPGMPLGSPGMDQGAEREAYDVLLIRPDGSTEIYKTYPASKQ